MGLQSAKYTPYYAAPEVLLSRAPSRVFYDLSSDIWSLGMTLAQMEIGSIPFMERSNIGMMFRSLKVFGTPASASEWEEVCDPACVLGTQGTHLFPNFRPVPSHPKPWGHTYDNAFSMLMDQLLVLIPTHRSSAQCLRMQRTIGSQWRVDASASSSHGIGWPNVCL